MKLNSRAVHVADRKRNGGTIPVTTPIHTATSFYYDDVETLDRILGNESPGQSYSRYGNPTNNALEEVLADLEGGAGALACSSGMAAMHLALDCALVDRRRTVLAAKLLYGATLNMLVKVFEPAGVETILVDFDDEKAVETAIAEHKPGAIVMETIVNPLVRVPAIDRIGRWAQQAGSQLIVDNTFATPLLIRPLEHGAAYVVHSLTKYLSGHGDVLGGAVITDKDNIEQLRGLSRMVGFILGPFESYMAMRGIKTFPLRMERQCTNAIAVARWLADHRLVDRVYFPGDPAHPDAATVQRVLPPGLYGGMISFEIKDAGREEVFRFMNSLKMIVPATSLGDVHSMMTYPAISSHRELAPKHRARLGIYDNLVRLSVGIEAAEDIVADLEQALVDAAC